MNKKIIEITKYTKGFNILLDVGSDHGYIPIYSVQNNYVKNAIACDINDGPLKNADNNIIKYNLKDKIKLIKSNGLVSINESFDVLTIAGLGGTVIENILLEDRKKLEQVKRIILQPNVASENCRRTMNLLDFKIVNEELIEDGKYTYEILVYEKGQEELSELELMFGPILLKERNPLLLDRIKNQVLNYDRIIDSLPKDKKKDWLLMKRDFVKSVLDE